MILITLTIFLFCWVVERLFAGWELPRVPSWFSRVFLVNGIQLAVVTLAGYSWERWLAPHAVFQTSQHLNPWLAGFFAYFIATFVFYWWHRLRHESDFFWKYFHQIHHSPQRLEVITSFYKHPLEMISNSIIGSLLIYTFLGLSIEAGAIYTLFTALGEFFYHTNIKTPQWVGYIFQRPEMHRIHHQYNSHKNNYGDFVIWDWLFGTYENPPTWSNKCGFDTKRELRLKDMLLFRDVHKLPIVALFALSPLLYSGEVSAEEKRLPTPLSRACEEAQANIQEGDLIFTAIPNYVFRKVASSTKSWTSHVGIVFKNDSNQWVVHESKIPFIKETPLCQFIGRSKDYNYESKRYLAGLTPGQIKKMKAKSLSLFGEPYDLSFDLDARGYFCSKFVYVLYEAVGLSLGEVETFKDLLEKNPDHSIQFWKFWFLGSIPWDRRTITPASQIGDPKFKVVIRNRNS